MFDVNPTTKEIRMYRGDTGEMTVTFAVTDYTPDGSERVLFTVKDGNGAVKISRQYTPDNQSKITVRFNNNDTDYLPAGAYRWDVRYLINPTLDPDTGEVIDVPDNTGDVDTPGSPFTLTLLDTVGQV